MLKVPLTELGVGRDKLFSILGANKLLIKPKRQYIGDRINPKYLALVTDSYSKKIMGFDVSNSLSLHGAERALQIAIANRCYGAQELIHHSDRGLQYCSDQYQALLRKHRIRCSMTES